MDTATWFGAGAITWALSVAVKMVAGGVVHMWTGARAPDAVQAALQGGVSAISELGLAALAFLFVLSGGSTSLVAIFGVGAGITEAAFLLLLARVQRGAEGGTETSEPADPPTAPPAVSDLRRHSFLVERVAALLGHVGSRGLIWLALQGSIWPAGVALLTFSDVDGVAGYGVQREWDWMAPGVWWRFYPFALAVGTLELALFIWLACC